MKRFSLMAMLVAVAAFSTTTVSAEQAPTRHEAKVAKKAAIGEEYRRSSLCMVMIEDPSMPKKDVIREAFFAAQIPNKYNDHNVGKRTFSISDIKINAADLEQLVKAEMAGRIAEQIAATGDANAQMVASTVSAAAADKVAAQALKFMNNQDMAYQLIRKWFYDEGQMKNSMELVQERGMVDASAASIANSETALDPSAILKDAGIELINNTFVVASHFKYMSKEELFQEVSLVTLAVAAAIDKQTGTGYATTAARIGLMATKASMGDGYYVRSNSYLFQLHWDAAIENHVWSVWDTPANWATQKNKFTLKYIGMDMGWAGTKASIFADLPEDKLIKGATINAMDNVLAKLEKRYEVFKTKVPLLIYTPKADDTGDGKKKKKKGEKPILYAKIGIKDGIDGGEKFEVLEAKIDKKTGWTTYTRKGVVKVSKSHIWDNTYDPSKGYDQFNEKLVDGEAPQFATYLDGGRGEYYDGLLLRQIK